jgi:hypothetical protein
VKTNKDPETRLLKAYASRTSDSASGIELHVPVLGATISLDDRGALSLITDLIPAARLQPGERQELIDFIRESYRDEDRDHRSDESSTLREIRAATAVLLREPFPSYLPGRWPNTYAYDFLRSHPELLPEAVREQAGPIDSRAAAAGAVRLWAQAAGVPADSIRAILADAYLEQHHIPLGFADHERAEHRRKVEDAHQKG